MPTIESRIAPDGAVTYRAKVRVKGAAQVSASFARKTDAAKWGHATEVAIREGRLLQATAATPYAFAGRNRSLRARGPPSQAARTAKFQARKLGWWRADSATFSWRTSLSAPSRKRAEETVRRPSTTNGTRGPATANRYMAVLSRAWPCANGSGLRSTLPTGCASSRNRGGVIAFSPRMIARVFSPPCKTSSNPSLHDVVLLALSTGMRRNEILSLRRSTRSTWHVGRSLI